MGLNMGGILGEHVQDPSLWTSGDDPRWGLELSARTWRQLSPTAPSPELPSDVNTLIACCLLFSVEAISATRSSDVVTQPPCPTTLLYIYPS